MPFALDSSPDISEVSEAINYLLANFGPGLSADAGTGQITGPTGQVSGYLYKYMAIKYADSFDGTVNFSDVPASHLYYGIRNNNASAESSNPADYIWYRVSGGFGGTKSLWYICTGGRQIQFAASVSAPDTGWLVDPGSSIDLDVVTSGNIPVVAETFFPYFTPNTLQVPRTGGVTPVFTNIIPVMYATDKGSVVPFTDAQTDSNVAFVNSSWRIGNSATTGFGDISYTNITIGSPTDAGDYAQWPAPTAMSSSPAYITVPVRYKNSLGVVTQAGTATVQLVFVDPGATGSAGPTIDISGYTGFVQNSGGAYTPTTATLSAVTTNVTAPTYSWTISGGTPTSATTASVVITPNSSATNVTVTLTVNGSNLSSAISKTMVLPIVYDGAAGQAGANGVMSAFPTIFIWTGSPTPPTRPSTTSTYTWSTGAYTAPSGWATTAPSNTTAGNYLWSITVPLNASATTTTSTLDWTNTAYPIRCVAFNGYNGTNGTNGTNGSNGSATFLVDRGAGTSSAAPSDAECIAAIGRTPVAGDICTVSYNSNNNAVVYRYTTSWVTQTTYITGSLIVQNTITADKMVTNLLSSDNVLTRGLTVRDNSGNIILSAGQNLDYSRVIASSGWLNSNITIGSNGVLSGGGGGTVSLTGLGAGSFATLSQITSANATTYIAGAAIGTAQVGVLTAGNIGAGTIDASKIAVNQLSAISANMGSITAGDLSIGSSPAISGTSMTGSGSHLYSNGNFAMGTASKNFVFDGSDVYLNGFSSSVTYQSSSSVLLPTYPYEIINFNVTKNITVVFGVSTNIAIQINSGSAASVYSNVDFYLYKIIAAYEMVAGQYYTIRNAGSTNFTLYGAPNNNVGTSFTCTSTGSGSGSVYIFNTPITNYTDVFVGAMPLIAGTISSYRSASFFNSQNLSPSTLGYSLFARNTYIAFYNSAGSATSPSYQVNLYGINAFAYVAKI